MKTTKQFSIYLSICILILAVSILAFRISNVSENNAADISLKKFSRDVSRLSFDELEFETWDVVKASNSVTKRDEKPYTIMVYMNGSDLESEDGAATDDLIEMLESGVDSKNLNLILFTGGANRWQNDVIPSNECVIWEIVDGELIKVSGVGLHNMGNAGTLSSFIEFSLINYPAQKYGLIMWDHGGGSIVGYGDDEKFIKGNLTLLDMNYAFEKAGLSKNRLEFLGFDSCLMATVEMAVIASDYAKYLIASQDLEPGDGWDYHFLSEINNNPEISGGELGIAIVDYFMSFYKRSKGEILTLSVIDLEHANNVMSAMGNLMDRCNQDLLANREKYFKTFSRKRNGTKTFGEGSPRDNESDMVDIGDMAYTFSDLYPNEVKIVIQALNNAVIYNKHNSNINLSGLSTYYIYGGKELGGYSLETYSALDMSKEYTSYLNKFYAILSENNKTRSLGVKNDEIVSKELTIWQKESENKFVMQSLLNKGELWPTINKKNVCLYKINDNENVEIYAIPASLNGKDGDVIVTISKDLENAEILGMRYDDGIIMQKGHEDIKIGDKLAFFYQVKEFGELYFQKDKEFVVTKELTLEWEELSGDNYFYSFRVTDLKQNTYFTKFRKNAELYDMLIAS